MVRNLVVALVLCAHAAALSAHHSVTAYYDTSRQLTLKGAVTSIEWTNPHAFVHIAVRDEQGAAVNWAVETDSPNVLSRAGWTRSTLQLGAEVSVTGYPSKKGDAALRLVTLALADGRKLMG
jgi:Family of unknown function (DUF6152)